MIDTHSVRLQSSTEKLQLFINEFKKLIKVSEDDTNRIIRLVKSLERERQINEILDLWN